MTEPVPIGVIPGWLHRQLTMATRMVELHEAILRYVEAGLPIDPLWASEYHDLAIDIDQQIRARRAGA